MSNRKYTTIMVERSIANEFKSYQGYLAMQKGKKRVGSTQALKELLERHSEEK